MYYEVIINGYIEGILKSPVPIPDLTEITEEMYQTVQSAISDCPIADEGKGYHLKEDLTWEEYELPVPEEEEPTAEEIVEILTGGDA